MSRAGRGTVGTGESSWADCSSLGMGSSDLPEFISSNSLAPGSDSGKLTGLVLPCGGVGGS